ncbi:MAG: ADP-ribosylation factor-like protein [Candidatus Thorarchaeota archaeon]
MIHTTLLIRLKSKRTVASTRYWTTNVARKDIVEYLKLREKVQEVADGRQDIPLIIEENKFFSQMCGSDLLLIFITDVDEVDRSVNEKIRNAAASLERIIDKFTINHIKETYEKNIAQFVHSRLKIALVGEGGVGKTTTLHLLMGRAPPTQYIPTIALGMETIENIHFANYSLVIWDFAGQERFRRLWKFYFKGADIVFLLSDSTLRNVLLSKEMYQMIKRDAPNVPVVVIANKQDKPNALDPSIIQRIIGVETHPMVAIDIAYRDEILEILLNTAANHVNVTVPDLPAEELLRFIDEEELDETAQGE